MRGNKIIAKALSVYYLTLELLMTYTFRTKKTSVHALTSELLLEVNEVNKLYYYFILNTKDC
jgi:hypothetical protein